MKPNLCLINFSPDVEMKWEIIYENDAPGEPPGNAQYRSAFKKSYLAAFSTIQRETREQHLWCEEPQLDLQLRMWSFSFLVAQ